MQSDTPSNNQKKILTFHALNNERNALLCYVMLEGKESDDEE